MIRNGFFDFFHDQNCDIDVNQRALHGIHRKGLLSCDLLIDETWRLDVLREFVAQLAQEDSGSEGDHGGFAWRYGSVLSADVR